MCVQFGALDDNLTPVLEEIEFYQITLTTDDNADVLAERSLANFFIEDNDGKVLLNMYVSIRMTNIACFIIYQHLAMYMYMYVNAEQKQQSLTIVFTHRCNYSHCYAHHHNYGRYDSNRCVYSTEGHSVWTDERTKIHSHCELGNYVYGNKVFFWHVHACVSSYQAKSFLIKI